MKANNPHILTINGGSSTIKFALFEVADTLRRILEGAVERIGLPEPTFRAKGLEDTDNFSRSVKAPDHTAAVNVLMDWIVGRSGHDKLTAVGHRVVHGGPKYGKAQRITAEMVEDLQQLSAFDPEHLPEEILLTEAFHRRFPDLPQVACFDTAFHHDMPRVAQLLPIPRRYEAQGVRRYGFHGLSYAFLMGDLGRLDGAKAARGRIILAHLGNGASLAAVHEGKSIDTSMSFTPTAGLPMSTRSGDIDPGLVWYLARTEQMSASNSMKWSISTPDWSGYPKPVRTCTTCSTLKRMTCERQRRLRCFAIRPRNGSAHSRPRWAEWTRWCSPAVSGKTLPRSEPEFAMDWDSSESNSTKSVTQRTRR